MQIYFVSLSVEWLHLDVCASILLQAFTYWVGLAELFPEI